MPAVSSVAVKEVADIRRLAQCGIVTDLGDRGVEVPKGEDRLMVREIVKDVTRNGSSRGHEDEDDVEDGERDALIVEASRLETLASAVAGESIGETSEGSPNRFDVGAAVEGAAR